MPLAPGLIYKMTYEVYRYEVTSTSSFSELEINHITDLIWEILEEYSISYTFAQAVLTKRGYLLLFVVVFKYKCVSLPL